MEAFIKLTEQLVQLLAELAWPFTALLALYYLRQPIGSLLDAFTDRIRDPRSDVSIGKEGLAIKSRLEALEIDQEQTKSLTLQALGLPERTVGQSAPPEQALDPELVAQADAYLAIEHPSWAQRVRLKDEAARQLADQVITRNVSRPLLARQAHEGLILALAAASHTLPREGDLELLLAAGPEAKRLHVKFRLVLAIARLFERGLASPEQVEPVRQLLKDYRQGADASLLERIRYTENALQGFEAAAS